MELTLDRHIEIDSGTRGGQPRIAGTRITVADVVLMHFKLDEALEEIAAKYDLSLASLHAALAYYFDHKEEIDQRMEEDRAFIEAFCKNNPSLLRAKLKALRGE
jgi:uncharacterized protein (DUF433 family)